MKRSSQSGLLAGMFLGTLAVTPAEAQTRNDQAADGWSARIGVIGAYVPEFEGADSYKVTALPDIEITYGNQFFLDRRGLGINVLAQGPLTAGVAVGYDDGREENDDRALTGLGDIDATAIGSIFANYSLGRWNFNATFSTDLLDEGHQGTTASVAMTYLFTPTDRLMLIVGPSLTWASDNYMQSNFGINAGQSARSGRRVYDAGSGLKDAGLMAFGIYRLSDHWAVTGIAGYKRLLGDAADSPLVEDDGRADQFISGLGLSYSF